MCRLCINVSSGHLRESFYRNCVCVCGERESETEWEGMRKWSSFSTEAFRMWRSVRQATNCSEDWSPFASIERNAENVLLMSSYSERMFCSNQLSKLRWWNVALEVRMGDLI